MALSKRAIVTAARLIDAHFLRLRRWQLKFAAEKGCTRSSEASRLSAAQRRAAYPIQLGVRYAGLFIRSGNRKKLYARHPLPTLPPSAFPRFKRCFTPAVVGHLSSPTDFFVALRNDLMYM